MPRPRLWRLIPRLTWSEKETEREILEKKKKTGRKDEESDTYSSEKKGRPKPAPAPVPFPVPGPNVVSGQERLKLAPPKKPRKNLNADHRHSKAINLVCYVILTIKQNERIFSKIFFTFLDLISAAVQWMDV